MKLSVIPYSDRISNPTVCSSKHKKLTVENIDSCTVNFQIFVKNAEKCGTHGVTTQTLKQVPKFLVDAFALLREDVHTVGLFRMSASCSRLHELDLKISKRSIPLDFGTHDICAIIKRFLYTLETPLLSDNELRAMLLTASSAGEISGPNIRYFFSSSQMPAVNKATFAYIMKELNYIAFHANRNLMSGYNLAVVMAPSLFIDEFNSVPAHGTWDNTIIRTAISCVESLIKHAPWIVFPRDPYLASWTRNVPKEPRVSSPSPHKRTRNSYGPQPSTSRGEAAVTALKDPDAVEEKSLPEVHFM